MIDSNTESPQEPTAVRARWAADGEADPAQIYVDEAVLHYVNERIYLALGQIQVPPRDVSVPAAEIVHIRPVANVVLTESSFHKILTMLNRVALQIPGRKEDKPGGAE